MMRSGAIGIALTDLFVSASAALMLVLAVLRPDPPVTTPLQADITAHCTETGGLPALEIPGDPPILVESPADLAALPARLDLPPRMFYALALAGGPGRTVPASCLAWASADLVRALNRQVASPGYDGPPAIFSLGPLALDP
ncbi:hypothetical protein [Marinibacterium profundimaris]|uniref:Uncharacterized protein n=1 Tax=Marinibacterium profundimaris TaxID=1679460 RepID=A0A225NR52_9RHOB|nr:hypothetical protein [Marinibacterium profundimaris]OWU77342.1 hypothetical protein ATO3_01040 [Marinibacterium profundimaris]